MLSPTLSLVRTIFFTSEISDTSDPVTEKKEKKPRVHAMIVNSKHNGVEIRSVLPIHTPIQSFANLIFSVTGFAGQLVRVKLLLTTPPNWPSAGCSASKRCNNLTTT